MASVQYFVDEKWYMSTLFILHFLATNN